MPAAFRRPRLADNRAEVAIPTAGVAAGSRRKPCRRPAAISSGRVHGVSTLDEWVGAPSELGEELGREHAAVAQSHPRPLWHIMRWIDNRR